MIIVNLRLDVERGAIQEQTLIQKDWFTDRKACTLGTDAGSESRF